MQRTYPHFKINAVITICTLLATVPAYTLILRFWKYGHVSCYAFKVDRYEHLVPYSQDWSGKVQ